MNLDNLTIQNWEDLAKKAKFRPADLAALCPTSLRQLERAFSKRFQTTPSLWMRELQCRQGRQLLSEGYSTKAAAAELAFGSGSHFCREFKKAFGASPQTFGPSNFCGPQVVVNGL